MAKRTKRTFDSRDNFLSLLVKWTADGKFKLLEKSDSVRLYQQGSGIIGPPVMLQVTLGEEQTSLEMWLRVPNLYRILGLFLLPEEIGLESGGYTLWSDRKESRKEMNHLLEIMGLPLIK